MRFDLLSGVQATAKGATCLMSGSEVVVRDGSGRDLLSGSKHQGLYRLNGRMVEHQEAVACTVSVGLAHRRLGHPGIAGTRSGAEKMGTVVKPGFGHETVKGCSVCKSAKQTRSTFTPSDSRADHQLELVHMDLMGPFPTASLGGARYALTLLDDYSRFCEVHVIKTKAEVFSRARGTLVLWQRQTGRKVKTIRTDNGTEFLGELDAWMKDKGISHQTSAEYHPEQNGRAERLNRTLKEKTRAMLLEHDLPHEFWGAAMDTACHVYNRITPEGDKMSPLELMFGEKPDMSSLRVFGCLAFVHIPKSKRRTLDAVSEPGIFAGYARDSKAWVVYVWHDNAYMSVKSRNVHFMENVRPDSVLGSLELEGNDVQLCPFFDASDDYVPEHQQESDHREGTEEVAGEDEDASAAGDSAVPEDAGGEAPPAGRYPTRVRRAPQDPYAAYVQVVDTQNDRPAAR